MATDIRLKPMLGLLRQLLISSSQVPQRALTAYRHRFAFPDLAPRPDEIIDVDPRLVCGHVSTELARAAYRKSGFRAAAVVGGDWDLAIRPVDFCARDGAPALVYESCRLHWFEGVPWEDTPLYSAYLDLINRRVKCDFASVEELAVSYRQLDSIFHQVTLDGRFSEEFPHLIKINVDRAGRLSWGPDGRHRLVMALLCKFDRIPARVGFVHPNGLEAFQALRRPAYKKRVLQHH